MEKRLRIKRRNGEYDFDPKEYYDFRVEYQNGKIDSLLKAGKITEERAKKVMLAEKQNYDANVADLEALDKLNKDIAIIVPTYWAQKPWLRSCLESIKPLGYHILLAYDNHFWAKKTANDMFPSAEVMSLADSVIMKHRTSYPSVGISYLWDMMYGLRLLKGFGFKYVFSINGDCILEKPENFGQIIEMFGDNDIICSEFVHERKYCGTVAMLAKIDMFFEFFEEFFEEQFVHKSSLEGELYKYVTEKNYTITPVRNSAHNYKMPDPNADWYNIVGLRHLHAEQIIRKESRYLPVEKEYFDFGTNNENVKKDSPLYNYYTTDDVKYLEDWWGPLV